MANNYQPRFAEKTSAKITKTVHHRIEKPAVCGAVYSHSVDNCASQWQQLSQATSAPVQQKQAASSYAQPQWNSVLRQVHALEALQAQQPPHFKSTAELTPRSKAAIAPQITQKLNFNAGQKVFKNLIPINVNDSILLPSRPTSIRKKYTKGANKAAVPELGDFLDLLPPQMLIIPEPDIHQEFPKHQFDYFGSYMRLFESI